MGLKINLEKSYIILVGMVDNMEELVSKIGCMVRGLLTSYLGLPLGTSCKLEVVWDGVEEWFRRRLSMRKRQYISKGKKLTMIHSTISNLPIYFMSFFTTLRIFSLRLEKIQRNFLWGGVALENKLHLVKR